MKNKFYITTPIYYVNDRPHIGHAYTTVAADVLARYHRLVGDEVFFLTGADEHGKKITDSASEAGQTPQEFADAVSDEFKAVWKKLNISNDHFIRTTSNEHKIRVREIFKKLKEAKTPEGNDVIYEGAYEGLYCTGCEKFITDKEIENNRCPLHPNKDLESVSEKNYFFRLKDYLDIIKEKIERDELLILPARRKAEVLGFFKQDLPDFSVSRESVKWGIPLPFDENQVSYVWVEALLNYITGLGYPLDGNYKKFWPADIQLMAQDIVKFHAIFWPAMLLALGLDLPKTEFVHGFFTINGQKMSKSLGNVINPVKLVEAYGCDITRYLLLSQFSFGSESDVREERFKEKYNADLANGLGNLVSRVANMLEKDGITLDIQVNSDEELKKKLALAFGAYKIDEALKILWDKLRAADEALSAQKPWEVKDIEKKKAILEPVAQDILNVAEFLQAFMPDTAKKIVEQFSQKQIKKEAGLFPRL